jgi:hypothetical protein
VPEKERVRRLMFGGFGGIKNTGVWMPLDRTEGFSCGKTKPRF